MISPGARLVQKLVGRDGGKQVFDRLVGPVKRGEQLGAEKIGHRSVLLVGSSRERNRHNIGWTKVMGQILPKSGSQHKFPHGKAVRSPLFGVGSGTCDSQGPTN